MAALGGIRLTGDWEHLGVLLDSKRFSRKLRAYVGKATRRNALDLRRQLRQEIKAGVPPSTAKLTALIKRSRKPLVDHGDLWKAITSVAPTWDQAFAGLLRTDPKSYNIGITVHDGAAIKVTPKMRGMFAALAHAYETGKTDHLRGRALELWERNPKVKWKALSPGTKVITIPARPFVRYAAKDEALRARIMERWKAAVAAAMTGKKAAAGGGGGAE